MIEYVASGALVEFLKIESGCAIAVLSLSYIFLRQRGYTLF